MPKRRGWICVSVLTSCVRGFSSATCLLGKPCAQWQR